MGTVPPPAGDGPKPLVGARPRPGVPCAAAAFASLRCTTWRQRPPEETWFSTGLGTPAPSRTGAEVGEGGHPTRRDQAPPSPEGRPAPWGGTAGLQCSPKRRAAAPRVRVRAVGGRGGRRRWPFKLRDTHTHTARSGLSPARPSAGAAWAPPSFGAWQRPGRRSGYAFPLPGGRAERC